MKITKKGLGYAQRSRKSAGSGGQGKFAVRWKAAMVMQEILSWQ